MSTDGRFVTFSSSASDLVADDTNQVADVFVRDVDLGTTTRVSVASDGTQGNFTSNSSSISADGRYVAFTSNATNLVPDDTNGRTDAFVYDTETKTTTLVSVASDGTEGNRDTLSAALSADGQFVVMTSLANNLVAGDTNASTDVFVHDMATGVTTRVSVSSTGQQSDAGSFSAPFSAITDDDNLVVFDSDADNLVAGDTNAATDIFVHDLSTGSTTLVSVSSAGVQGDDASINEVISGDGSAVAFSSFADNLVPDDTNGVPDLFVRHLATATTTLESRSSSGELGNDYSCCSKGISDDGRYVAFRSHASNLVSGDTNDQLDAFWRDTAAGVTVRASVSSTDQQLGKGSANVTLSGDGRFVGFISIAGRAVPGDTNKLSDDFRRGPMF